MPWADVPPHLTFCKHEDTKRKTLQIALIATTVGAWIVLALMIVRQIRLLAYTEPMRDTGLSFSYAMLTNIGIPALLGVTIVVAVVLIWMNRSHLSPNSKFKIQQS